MPPFTTLAQEAYTNENGHPVAASSVQALAPYRHLFDGFYEWECGRCGVKHSSRSCGWPIAGQVLVCERDHAGCGTQNLLVKTNVKELDECFGMKVELERERDRLRHDRKTFDGQVQSTVQYRVGRLLEPLKDAIAATEKRAVQKEAS